MKKLLLSLMFFFATANGEQFDLGYADSNKSNERSDTYYEFLGFDPRDVSTVQVKDLTYQALPKTAAQQQRNFLNYCLLALMAGFVFDSFSVKNNNGEIIYNFKPLSTAFKWCSNAAWLSGL